MSKFWAALMCAALLAPAAALSAASTDEITKEAGRSTRIGDRLVSFWWLPAEFWEASARELKRDPALVEEVRKLYSNYTLVAALDVQMRPDGSADALSTAEIVRRTEFQINGASFEVLREVDPRLQQYSPDLLYAFRSSMSGLGGGLRLIPLPNVGSDGVPILGGSRGGFFHVTYKAVPDHDPAEFWWHGPLTTVEGAKRCKRGDPAQASWKFCPWDGAELKEGASSP